MFLKKISLINFKNYSETALEFSEDVNCFTGNNGVGKTNLLDAIHYLSFCKSYFNSTDSQNINYGKEFFMVQGEFDYEGIPETIYCSVSQNQRKIFKRNKKEYTRLSEHIGIIPAVMISPSDISLINEGSRVRRKFIDSIISQYDKQYLDGLISYNKALEQRDSLLKHFAESGKFDFHSLEIWDKALCDSGKLIFRKRKKFLGEFIPVFRKYFRIISNDAENVTLEYESQLNETAFDKILSDCLMRDRAAQRSTTGIHKDDLIFKLGDHPIKMFGSQGQQKSYLIALKLAQFECIKEIKKLAPVLLLDDIFDKLDIHRIHALMQLVSCHHFGQIFITDTDESRIRHVFKKINVDLKLFKIGQEKIMEI